MQSTYKKAILQEIQAYLYEVKKPVLSALFRSTINPQHSAAISEICSNVNNWDPIFLYQTLQIARKIQPPSELRDKIERQAIAQLYNYLASGTETLCLGYSLFGSGGVILPVALCFFIDYLQSYLQAEHSETLISIDANKPIYTQISAHAEKLKTITPNDIVNATVSSVGHIASNVYHFAGSTFNFFYQWANSSDHKTQQIKQDIARLSQ